MHRLPGFGSAIEGGDVPLVPVLNSFSVRFAQSHVPQDGIVQMQRATVNNTHSPRAENAYANQRHFLAIRRVGPLTAFGESRNCPALCVTQGPLRRVSCRGPCADQNRSSSPCRSRTVEKALLQISRGNLLRFFRHRQQWCSAR